MAFYDVAAAQQPISPIDNYYQGKAIRLGLKGKELQNQAAQLDIDMAPQKMEIDRQNARNKAAEVEIRVKEHLAKMGDAQREATENAAAAALSAYDDGGDEAAATEAFATSMTASGYKVPEGIVADEISMRAIMGDAKTYRELQKSNQQLTADEKLINRLPISEEEKARLREAIAVKKGTITGTTEFDPGSDPRTNSQRGAAYQENLDTFTVSSDVQEMITDALPKVMDLPKTVGATGKFAMGGAGFLATLGQDELATAFAEYVSGADVETINQMQTQLQIIRGRLIPLVTGEQGKRLSEMEREIASRTVGLIEQGLAPGDLAKSYPQVIGAMKQLYIESWATKYRVASNDQNFQFPYDLDDTDEVTELVSEFLNAGIDQQNIRSAVVRLKAIQNHGK